ncbi:MAG TPA: hypothetical protein VD931_11400 [Baekduia sp.]|nr:hypothetical protein [Baekduia sp.]
MAVLAGYAHLQRAAERLQWDEAALALRADAPAARALAPDRRSALRRLVAGFCVAERAVAEHLEPFGLCAADDALRALFEAQAADERRHARFFERVAREVLDLDPGAGAAALAAPALHRLFGSELPTRARALAAGQAELGDAVALYHLVLEGAVLQTGQDALLELLDEAGTLPAVRDGVARVQADERWHVGLGVACLLGLGAPPPDLERLLEDAVRCWDADLVDGALTRARLRRRLDLLAEGAGRRA